MEHSRRGKKSPDSVCATCAATGHMTREDLVGTREDRFSGISDQIKRASRSLAKTGSYFR